MSKSNRLSKTAFKEVDFSKQRYNLVAIIERGGKIVSIGNNSMNKSHRIFWNGDHDKGVHAEFSALSQTRDSKGSNMHIFRFKRDGTHGDSKPCKNCMGLIRESGVKKIFYWINGGQVIEKVSL